MIYTSTRDKSVRVTAAEAIAKGISSEGGLFVPTEIPAISKEFIEKLVPMSYIERAKEVLRLYLTDFTEDELSMCVEGAYKAGKFSSEKVAPLYKLSDKANVLELWRGPTCAFKDMALQLLPYLLTVSAGKTVKDTEIVILVATSGDTGKAALEGFADVPNTKILVFYPVDGVSPMQKLQMTTQEGSNVSVCAIEGNFDDAQSGVKKIFTDKDIEKKFKENGLAFSSANSINWGRLVPQIVYYVSAYCDMLQNGELNNGEEMNVVVPTGNFGNILAAYYAKKMGIPVKTLICASNANNVLTDFLTSGTYDKNRDFYCTTSPSMDILISSNLERLIYRIAGNDSAKNLAFMTSLSKDGKYVITDEMKSALSDFYGNYATEAETGKTIKDLYEKTGYVIDTHTAVAANVYGKYKADTKDDTVTVIASTASPFKFARSVMNAIDAKYDAMSDFELIDELSKVGNVAIPNAIEEIRTAPVLHKTVCDRTEMEAAVKNFLGIQ